MKWNQLGSYLAVTVLISGLLLGCGGSDAPPAAATMATHEEAGDEHDTDLTVLELPVLEPVDLQGGKLRVVVTTSIIGDVVARVGGDALDLTVLMAAGQDPHSYQPGARELTAVADAHIIFVNGWDLEEALLRDLANIGEAVTIVPVSAYITPLAFNQSGEAHEDEAAHDHASADPHVWFSVANVEQWVKNINLVLGSLDPGNAQVYDDNAAAYLAELAELETYITAKLGAIPATDRFLVTNHGAFGYLAAAYDFTIVGTVIPGLSTLAEPSASDLTDLVAVMAEHQVCSIFTDTTVSDQLAQVVAAELTFCESIQVLPLYTGSLGPAGSGADSYLGLMKTNVDKIILGLQ